MEVGLGVAVEVLVPEQIGRFRVDRDLVRETALPRQVPRTQMELAVAAGDLAVVVVGRAVLDPVRRRLWSPGRHDASFHDERQICCGGGGG